MFNSCKTYGYITGHDDPKVKETVHVRAKGLKIRDIDCKEVGFDHEPPSADVLSTAELANRRKRHMFRMMVRLLDKPQSAKLSTISVSRTRKVRYDLLVYEKLQTKIISGLYTKGHVRPDGYIEPFVVSTL